MWTFRDRQRRAGGRGLGLAAAPTGLLRLERLADGHRLTLCERLVLADAAALWTDVRRHLAPLERGARLEFDMSRVTVVDGGAMALLVHVRSELAARGVAAEFANASASTQELIHLYAGDAAPTHRRGRRPEPFLAQVGRSTLEVVEEVKGVLAFIGAAVRALLGILNEPKTANWKEVAPTMERMGVDALPIVIVINLLVGFVIAYQGAAQLSQFGADIYVADLVGKSITREMGPLMTAIILCGRSGAAFAAELGAMKVSEEIDALRTMGFGPVRYLVLPRIVALMLVLPMLTLVGEFVAILGGLAVGVTSLNLTAQAYLGELRGALDLWDVFSGLIKSVVFGFAIGLIACRHGFAATGGAEGVGRRTTKAVVSILFALILIDAGFTVFFHAYDL